MIIGTVLGNCMVCRAVFRNPRLRTVTNYSVLLLAFSDLAMGILVMPLLLIVSLTGEMPFPNTVCQMEGYVATSLVYTSVLTVTFMAVNRYFKIVKTSQYRVIFTRKKTLCMLIVIVVVAWSGPMNTLAQGQTFEYHPGKMLCMYSYRQMSKLQFILLVIFYFSIPYCVTIYCYVSIFRSVRQHNAVLNQGADSHLHIAVNRKEVSVAKTLFAIFMVFTLGLMQLAVIDCLEVFWGEYSRYRQTYVMYTVMCAMASAINPVIYGLMNKTFRREYKRTIYCGILANRVISIRAP
ncbi:predicted protein [Nematostella vectensis]|uniref:G-protein coupled receptors family 1 profile domain-containing protein n=1 Tax=Nematostella vectensis TaxID=45351 RepID=A7SWN5_NEMVE|nr:predicted protein [Nematostella vectensis]|eukprot:XP_001623966.1 predicted protein [Nematostella vectensis]